MIKENKKKVFLMLSGLLLLAGWFYWFQWRPAQIRNSCDRIAWDDAISKTYDPYWKNYREELDQKEYDWKYTQCLHSKGLK